jgi:hypothetical protein
LVTATEHWIFWISICFSFAAALGLIASGSLLRRGISVALATLALVVPFGIWPGSVLRAAVGLELVWVCMKVIGLAREHTPRSALFRALHLLVLHDLRQDSAFRGLAAGERPRFRPELRWRLLLASCVWGVVAAPLLWLALFQAPALPAPSGRLLRCAAGLGFAYTGVEGALGLFEFMYRAGGLRPPIFHQQPIRATSVGEFWGRRWNRIVGSWLFAAFYRPLAARGRSGLGLVAAFVASAVLHLYFTWAAVGLAAGARMALFFVLQLPPLWLERRLAQSRWPLLARRLWTLAWLGLCSPLFVEPMLDILAGGFNPGF